MSMAAMLGAARGGRFSISDRSRRGSGDDRGVAEWCASASLVWGARSASGCVWSSGAVGGVAERARWVWPREAGGVWPSGAVGVGGCGRARRSVWPREAGGVWPRAAVGVAERGPVGVAARAVGVAERGPLGVAARAVGEGAAVGGRARRCLRPGAVGDLRRARSPRRGCGAVAGVLARRRDAPASAPGRRPLDLAARSAAARWAQSRSVRGPSIGSAASTAIGRAGRVSVGA
jgi:hypothetical protein